MTNQFYILVCATLLIMTGVLLVSTRRERRRYILRAKNMLLYSGLMAWQGLEIAYFVAERPAMLRFIYDAKLAVIAFLAVLVFIIIIQLYRVQQYFPTWLTPTLCIVPGVTALFALTTNTHDFLLKHFEVLATDPLTMISATRGAWFFVHTGYSIALVLAMVCIIIFRYKDLPKAYRSSLWPLVVASAILLVGIAAEITHPGKHGIDMVLVAANLASLLFYVAIVRNGRSDYLQIERREIFNYLDPAAFVLSLDGQVLDMNRPARSFLDILGENAEGEPFDQFMQSLYAREKLIHKGADSPEEGGDSYFVIAKYPVIYRMHRQSLLDSAGAHAGAVVTLTDVTLNRLFIERLQNMAGIDGLTGLHNRYGYQNLLRTLDIPENLPICVIMGDVNGLKRVNDTYGHAEGDRFLVAVADDFKSSLNQWSYGARVGGDEFVIVAIRCDMAGGERIINSIHAALERVDNLPERPSIALGLAVKSEPAQNINSLIANADTEMYSTKAPGKTTR